MRFKRYTAFMLGVFLLFLTGCSPKNVEQKRQEDTIKGSMLLWADKDSLKAAELSVENFKKLHSNAVITVELVDKPQLFLKLDNVIKSGSGIPDIVLSQDEDIQKLLKNYPDAFMDTTGIIKKDSYLKYKIDNLTRDGKLLGIPLNVRPAALLYRKDLLQASGVNPEYIKTWWDLISAGRLAPQSAKVSTMALPLQEEKTYRLFINQLGASYFDKDGNPIMNSPQIKKAADMLKAFYAQGTLQNVDGSVNTVDLLVKGKIDCAIVSLEEINSVMKNNPEMKGKLGLMRLPAYEEGGNQAADLGGYNELIASSVKNKELVFEFSKFLSEDRGNIKNLLESNGFFPACINYYDEAWFSKKEPYFEGIKLWRLMVESSQDMYGINYTENFSMVAPAVKDAFQNIVLKDADINANLNDLENKFNIVK